MAAMQQDLATAGSQVDIAGGTASEVTMNDSSSFNVTAGGGRR